jgi:hypothetical protein
MHNDLLDDASNAMRLDTPTSSFNLWQFGHVPFYTVCGGSLREPSPDAKNPGMGRGFRDRSLRGEGSLFDFAFFIHHVFTRHWIVLFHLQFVGRGALVLVGGIEVSGTCGRVHSDFVSHDSSP